MIRGFTLLEITIVIIVAGVLAGLALPRLMSTAERFRAQEGENLLRALYAAQQRQKSRTGGYADSLAALDVEVPSLNYFSAPSVSTDPNNLASIARPRQYTLSINAAGRIACTPAAACGKIGY